MDRTLRHTTANTTTATSPINQGKRVGGFANKRHDQATKNRISQTQKARYNYMKQMMRQHQQNEQSQQFGPIDIDSPTFTQRVKDIVREILNEEIKKATPIRQNIPIF